MKKWIVEQQSGVSESVLIPMGVFLGSEVEVQIGSKTLKVIWNQRLQVFLYRDLSSKNQSFKVLSVKSLHFQGGETATIVIEGLQFQGSYQSHVHLDNPARKFRHKKLASKDQTLPAPMTGRVLKICKKDGSVKVGETLLIIDAMKMENQIQAPSEAVIDKFFVGEGAAVKVGDPLVRFL